MSEIEANAVIADTAVTVAPPPPPPHRRPRVREVSSRFMSPVASSSSSSSSSCSDLHTVTAKSPHHRPQQHQHQQRHRRHQDNKDTESTDENRPIETSRSLESPFQFHSTKESFQRRRQQQQQQQPRSVIKLFNDNNSTAKFTGRYRQDTPTVANSSSSSRPRTLLRSTTTTSNTASAAAKLLHISTQPSSSDTPPDDTSSNVDDTDNDARSCTSDTDMLLPTISSRMLSERNINRVNSTPIPSSRQISSSQNGLFSSVKGGEKPTPALSRSFSNSAKIGGLPLPPVAPPQAKPGTDARKGRKVSSHQEDVHSLKMLHNHDLQWRFANAKAEASTQAQKRETEKSLYSLEVKISELYDSVKRKRIELDILKRTKTLSTILEAQMPYLDEWCAFEGDYSSCLSEATQALLNSLIQLPISGNIKADVREVGDALNSSVKLMEMIILHLQSFMPKAAEVEILISELAKVTGGERALVEECGGLLSKTRTFQVEECSLRGQLMQLHHQRLAAEQETSNSSSSLSASAIQMR